MQDIEFGEEKIKQLFKKRKNEKENTMTMTITILMKETLKVITAMRMTMTTKAKMSKLMPERKKTLR